MVRGSRRSRCGNGIEATSWWRALARAITFLPERISLSLTHTHTRTFCDAITRTPCAATAAATATSRESCTSLALHSMPVCSHPSRKAIMVLHSSCIQARSRDGSESRCMKRQWADDARASNRTRTRRLVGSVELANRAAAQARVSGCQSQFDTLVGGCERCEAVNVDNSSH